MRKLVALLLLICVAGGCKAPAIAPGKSPDTRAQSTSARFVVEKYLAALNRRDLLVLTAYVAPDVRWYSVTRGDQLLEAASREQLTTLLEQYFTRYPHTRWTTESMLVLDRSLAVIERSEWGVQPPYESRKSFGVYQIDDGRIKQITYFVD